MFLVADGGWVMNLLRSDGGSNYIQCLRGHIMGRINSKEAFKVAKAKDGKHRIALATEHGWGLKLTQDLLDKPRDEDCYVKRHSFLTNINAGR
jgi:hypothetical protein